MLIAIILLPFLRLTWNKLSTTKPSLLRATPLGGFRR